MTNLSTPSADYSDYVPGQCVLNRAALHFVRPVEDPETVSWNADLVEPDEVSSWRVCMIDPRQIQVAGYVCPDKTAAIRQVDAAGMAAFLPTDAPILIDHGDSFELVDGSHRIARATELGMASIPVLVGMASAKEMAA